MEQHPVQLGLDIGVHQEIAGTLDRVSPTAEELLGSKSLGSAGDFLFPVGIQQGFLAAAGAQCGRVPQYGYQEFEKPDRGIALFNLLPGPKRLDFPGGGDAAKHFDGGVPLLQEVALGQVVRQAGPPGGQPGQCRGVLRLLAASARIRSAGSSTKIFLALS